MWLRERARIEIPCPLAGEAITIEGDVLPPGDNPAAAGAVGLKVAVGRDATERRALADGPFSLSVPLPPEARRGPVRVELAILGVARTNALAFLGRKLDGLPGGAALAPFRRQPLNKRLRIRRVTLDGEPVIDFATSATAFDVGFLTRHAALGLNLVGWFRAELGVGESVRCAARAAAAARLPHALVPLKLFCKAAQGDTSFDDRLGEANPHPVNVFHVDAPQTRDIDHHHGPAFRRGKYNIAYWAWELPEFPDGWVRHCDHVDEIWTPSRFTRDSIAAKVPVPVLVTPHAIDFAVPERRGAREAFGLPADRFLFLFLYDLNSYQERKNPRAVLQAYRSAFGATGRADVGLVIKVHGVAGNEHDLAALRDETAGLDGCTLLAGTLPRADVYRLQQACDGFVSLHRSEGFGLAVAEAMFLGKPVVSTDWSGTAEFVDETNGCPVRHRMITLERNHGPYTKGQHWADPDIEHAAHHMRRLVSDPALCARLGAVAAASIRRDFSPAAIGARYAARLRAMALW